MHPHKEQIDAAILALQTAHDTISESLTEPSIAALKTKTQMDLQRSINFLTTKVGGGVAQNVVTRFDSEPLTTVMGKYVGKGAPVPATPAVKLKNHKEQLADEIREKAHELYDDIENITNDALLDTYSDFELRTIGKIAGLPITEKHPKKIDAKVLDQIREAKRKKLDIEAKGKTDADNDK